MKKQLTDEEIVQRTTAALNRKAESLDAATLSKLNQSRQRALTELGRTKSPSAYWLPAAGATACAVVAVALFMNRPLPEGDPTELAAAAIDDLEILMADESIDMLQDLEFFELMEVLDEMNGGAETKG